LRVRSPKRLLILARRVVMNRLMATRWYPALRRRLRTRASTGTGEMDGERFAWHVHNNFDVYRRHLQGRVDDFAGLRVMEVGPGEHLGIALQFVAAGAREAVCIDRAREVRNEVRQVRRMYEDLRARLSDAAPRGRFDAALARLPECEKPGGPILYRPDLPLEEATSAALGRFDLIVSSSVLEHVGDLSRALRVMRDLLQPGGWMAHCVDLASHDRYESYPLEFLEVGPRLWSLQFRNLGGPNRFRIGHYRRFLQEEGFRDVHLFADGTFSHEDVARARPRLAPCFRDLTDEDLRASVIFFCARRPAN